MKRDNVFAFLLTVGCIFSLFSCNRESTLTKEKFSYASGTTTDYANDVYYSDDYFTKPATTYSDSLATASLCFAMSSFATNRNTNAGDYSYRYKNAEKFLTSFGYSSITPNADYQKKPGPDTIGVLYGKKTIGNDTMIAIGIRGSNYEQEWASNFTLGKYADNSYHQGFYNAALELIEGLNDYIVKENINGNIKLWMAGYSRAGATCNLASGLLDKSLVDNTHIIGNQVTYSKEDVYAYCFEAPQGAYFDPLAEEVEVKGENYSNIFNIINNNDPVPKVAMTAFNFTRFGIDRYLTDSLIDPDYSDNISKVKNQYGLIQNYAQLGEAYLISDFDYKSMNLGSGEEVVIDHVNWIQSLFLEDFITALSNEGVKQRDAYVEGFQEGLRDIFILVYKNGQPQGSFVEFGMNFVKEILSSDEADILMDDLLHNQSYFVKDLIPLLKRTLTQSGIDITIEELFKDVNNLLKAIVNVFTYSQSLIMSLISMSNVKAIGSAHYPELCLSHLQARDPNYVSDPVASNMDGRYYRFTSSDTSKSFTIKKGDKVIAKLDNGRIVKVDTTATYALDSGNFVAYFPIAEGYTVLMDNESTASLSIYEPSKIKFVDVRKDFTSKIGNSKLDDNVSVVFNS